MAKFNTGQSFSDGDTVTGAKLNNITSQLNIYTGVISEQTAMSATVSTADQLLIADVDNGDSGAANRITVQKLLNDTLTNGTFTNVNLTGNLNVTQLSTLGTLNNTRGTVGILNSTTGTIATLNSTTGTIAGLSSTTGTIATLNSTTGTISNLSTTLAGDLTISQGTATLSTTGATAATYGTTSAIPVLTVDAKGRVTSGTSVTNPVGFRNRIINGNMAISQRGTSFVSPTDAYAIDRWEVREDTDGAVTLTQETDAPEGFSFSQKLLVTTADASLTALQYLNVAQYIEGFNTSDLSFGSASASTITLSFWVKSSLTGTFGGALQNFARDRSYPFTYAISSANTWEKKTLTISGDTSGTWIGATNSIGLRVIFSLGAGSTYSGTAGAWVAATNFSATSAVSVIGTLNATWQITGVQLEAGSTATDFERRPIGTELALCYRYLPFFTLSNATIGIIGQATATNTAYYTLPFQNTARTSPTGITLTTGTLRAFTSALATAGGTGAFNSAQTTQGQIVVTGATGLVAGNATYLNPSATMTILWTGCEL